MIMGGIFVNGTINIFLIIMGMCFKQKWRKITINSQEINEFFLKTNLS